MPRLRVEKVDGESLVSDWRQVHNLIIPTAVLTLDEVRERAQRNHLEVAYLGETLVGCTTVRPPTSDSSAATVIVRVLDVHRRQGFGTELYERALALAHEYGPDQIETVILASNVDGLRFAQRHGFVEVDRYVLPGDIVAFVELRLSAESATGKS